MLLQAGQLAVDMGLDKRVGFMGAGQMAEALARGLMHKGVLKPAQICCTDPVNNRKELFKSFGATPYDTNLEVGAACFRNLGITVNCCVITIANAGKRRVPHSTQHSKLPLYIHAGKACCTATLHVRFSNH